MGYLKDWVQREVATDPQHDPFLFAANILEWLIVGLLVAFVLTPILKKATARTPTNLDRHMVGIVAKPAVLLLFAYGIWSAFELHVAYRSPTVERIVLAWVGAFWGLLLWGIVTYVAFRVWHEVILGVGRSVAAKTESKLDDRLFPLFDKLGGVAIVLIGFWFSIASLGVNMTGFTVGGAIGGLVIAFAAQDTLGNLFAGVFILIDQPFREGDRIEIQELNTWGDVTYIGLRTTRVRTRDNRMVIVPNSVIGSNPVVNHSFPDTSYRIQTHVGIAYGSDVERARQAMVEATRAAEGVDQDNMVEALFVEFADSALLFRVRCWLPSYADARRVLDRVHTNINARLAEEGVEIPFPQRTIWHGAGQAPAAGHVPGD